MIPRFRAWHKKKKMMIKVMGLGWIGSGEVIWVGDATINTGTPLADWDSVTEYILMQSTGLKEKNGKEIFEGDIVSGAWSSYMDKAIRESPSIIKNEDGCFWVESFFNDEENNYLEVISDFKHSDMEIIGNIHENPELLEVRL